MTMSNNVAHAGSAVFHESTPTAPLIISASSAVISLQQNVASEGGTIFSVVGKSWRAQDLQNLHRAVFQDNVGGTVVTQSRTLRGHSGGATMHVLAYGTVLRPSPSFTLVDGYGSTNTTDSASTVTVSVRPPFYCGGGSRIGYLSGVTTTTVNGGFANFDALQAYCYPGGNITVVFTAALDGFNSSYNVETSVKMVFRPCVDGEVLLSNECERCPERSYSLRYSPTAQCLPYPPHADGSSGNVILVSKGYWRPSPLSTVFLECPYPAGCLGGAAAGGSNSSTAAISSTASAATNISISCAAGYEGPLCGVCSVGYYLDRSQKRCSSCGGGNDAGQLAVLIVVPLVLLIVAFVGFSKLDRIVEALNAAPKSDSDQNTVAAAAATAASKVWARLSSLVKDVHYPEVVPKVKITVTYLQVSPSALFLHD
jgi:hypothetical protein